MTEGGWLKALARTAGLRLVTLPLTAGLAVVTASVAVRLIGSNAYGYVSLIAQLTLLLPFADLGLGAAVTRRIAQARVGMIKPDEALGLVRHSMFILSCIGVFGASVSIALGLTNVWSRVLHAPSTWAGGVNLSTSITLAIFFLLLPLAVGQRVLVGLDRSGLLVVLGLLPPLFNLLFILLAGTLNLSPMLFALGTSVGSVVTVSMFAAFAFGKRLGGVGSPLAARSKGRGFTGQIVHAAVPMLLVSLGTAAAIQSGRVILAGHASVRDLSEFALAFQLYLPLYSVIYMASTVLWPRFAVSLNRRLWVLANGTLLALSICAGVGYVVFGPLLVTVMSNHEVILSPALAIGFALLLTVQGLHATQAMLLTSVRGFWVQAGGAVAAGVLTLVLSVVLSSRLGVVGPAYAASIGLLVALVVPCVVVASRLTRGSSRP